jgi:hypothetical protein
MSEIRAELDAALATARHALEQFNAEPIVASKRGGPRLSPWFRVWVQASEVAQRWHRQLQLEKPEPTIDEELDRLLGKPQDSGDGGPVDPCAASTGRGMRGSSVRRCAGWHVSASNDPR